MITFSKFNAHSLGRSQKFLITGGTGFVGTNLVDVLNQAGHEIWILTRQQRDRSPHPNVHFVQTLNSIPIDVKFDVVVNLAGARILGWRWSEKRKAELRESRVGLTQRVIAWLSKHQDQPGIWIQASAIGYYGVQALGDEHELDETASPQSIFMSQLCQDWEASSLPLNAIGWSVSILRFGLILGDGGALPMMSIPVQLGLAGRFGSGQQWYSWIHIDDVLSAIEHILSNRKGQADTKIFNCVAPFALRQIDFHKILAKKLRRPCFLPTPAWPVRLLLGEQGDLLLEGQRVYPAQLLAENFDFKYPDLESALSQLYK